MIKFYRLDQTVLWKSLINTINTDFRFQRMNAMQNSFNITCICQSWRQLYPSTSPPVLSAYYIEGIQPINIINNCKVTRTSYVFYRIWTARRCSFKRIRRQNSSVMFRGRKTAKLVIEKHFFRSDGSLEFSICQARVQKV